MDLYGKPVVYVDIETSGRSYKTSGIIEVAAIRVENGQVVQEFTSLVNPGGNLPHWITNLTGITQNDVAAAPYFADIAHELHAILDGAIFVAHNVRFDYSYIKRQLAENDIAYTPKLLCTVRLSRALYADQKGHSLQKIIERHGLAVAGRHRAYDDAKAIKDFAELAYAEHGTEHFAAAVARQLKTQSLPAHLDEAAFEAVGNQTGVYVLEDEMGRPSYIGKSVSIRKRLLSHFNQDVHVGKEMKIAQSTHKLRVIETDSELEALLLESKMIKELLPLHNRKLRRKSGLVSLVRQTNTDGYYTVSLESIDLTDYKDLSSIYGVYTSRGKAKAALEDKLRTFDLCSKLLGLENTKGACFLHQLGKCRGACVGKESAVTYNLRVELAMQRSKVESWPYKGPVAIKSGSGKSLVVDNWMVLGYLEEVEEGEPFYRAVESSFDIDTYRILRSYLKTHASSLSIVPVGQQLLRRWS
jgi:DNA polymerase III subunit epsilon